MQTTTSRTLREMLLGKNMFTPKIVVHGTTKDPVTHGTTPTRSSGYDMYVFVFPVQFSTQVPGVDT